VWVKPITGKKQMKGVDGLTKEEAEYKAVIAVLEYVGESSRVQIRMDSATMSKQITYPLPVRDPRLNALLSEALKLENEKCLPKQLRDPDRSREVSIVLESDRR
jgi:ribonuclease HI